MASSVLQKGADYTACFAQHHKDIADDDAKDVRGLEAEYYILRTALVSPGIPNLEVVAVSVLSSADL